MQNIYPNGLSYQVNDLDVSKQPRTGYDTKRVWNQQHYSNGANPNRYATFQAKRSRCDSLFTPMSVSSGGIHNLSSYNGATTTITTHGTADELHRDFPYGLQGIRSRSLGPSIVRKPTSSLMGVSGTSSSSLMQQPSTSGGVRTQNYQHHLLTLAQQSNLFTQGPIATACSSSTGPGLTTNQFPPINNQPISYAKQHSTRASPVTVNWLLENYEAAEGVSLSRSALYSSYLNHCLEQWLEPMNPASFGKLIRSVFIGLRTRRLGTRGNSKYHYYGIRIKPTSMLNHTTPDLRLATKFDPTGLLPGRTRSLWRDSFCPPSINSHQQQSTNHHRPASSSTQPTANRDRLQAPPPPSVSSSQPAWQRQSMGGNSKGGGNQLAQPIVDWATASCNLIATQQVISESRHGSSSTQPIQQATSNSQWIINNHHGNNSHQYLGQSDQLTNSQQYSNANLTAPFNLQQPVPRFGVEHQQQPQVLPHDVKLETKSDYFSNTLSSPTVPTALRINANVLVKQGQLSAFNCRRFKLYVKLLDCQFQTILLVMPLIFTYTKDADQHDTEHCYEDYEHDGNEACMLASFHKLYEQHCAALFATIVGLRFDNLHSIWHCFWSTSEEEKVSITVNVPDSRLIRMCDSSPGCDYIEVADRWLYQKLLRVIVKDCLNSIPLNLANAIRLLNNFAMSCLRSAIKPDNQTVLTVKSAALDGFTKGLRRALSLSQLSQPVQIVLNNPDRLSLMHSDLVKLDIDTVEAQASWASSCQSDNLACKLSLTSGGSMSIDNNHYIEAVNDADDSSTRGIDLTLTSSLIVGDKLTDVNKTDPDQQPVAQIDLRQIHSDLCHLLSRGESELNNWASWLDGIVQKGVTRDTSSTVRTGRVVSGHIDDRHHKHRRQTTGSIARELMLVWNYYSSLIMRELTLRSAASFDCCYLVRLFCDEYLAYRLEQIANNPWPMPYDLAGLEKAGNSSASLNVGRQSTVGQKVERVVTDTIEEAVDSTALNTGFDHDCKLEPPGYAVASDLTALNAYLDYVSAATTSGDNHHRDNISTNSQLIYRDVLESPLSTCQLSPTDSRPSFYSAGLDPRSSPTSSSARLFDMPELESQSIQQYFSPDYCCTDSLLQGEDLPPLMTSWVKSELDEEDPSSQYDDDDESTKPNRLTPNTPPSCIDNINDGQQPQLDHNHVISDRFNQIEATVADSENHDPNTGGLDLTKLLLVNQPNEVGGIQGERASQVNIVPPISIANAPPLQSASSRPGRKTSKPHMLSQDRFLHIFGGNYGEDSTTTSTFHSTIDCRKLQSSDCEIGGPGASTSANTILSGQSKTELQLTPTKMHRKSVCVTIGGAEDKTS